MEIYTYYVEFTSKRIANKIKKQIFESTRKLSNEPKLGRIESSLSHISGEHRFIISSNYRIIYKLVKEGVLITDIFDTRQNPKKIQRPFRSLE